MSENPTMLGPSDEPHNCGAVVVVHYGNYRRQEIFVSSGANLGNWYCLGGEFGVPRHGSSELPLHPVWADVLARGPVTLLSAGDQATYAAGWAAGRRRMVQQMEELGDGD
jgi:hypothetical protein